MMINATPRKAPTSSAWRLQPPALVSVRVEDDEDVEWQWTHFADGRSTVTGYRLVSRFEQCHERFKRRIRDRFPEDFAYQHTQQEFTDLKSQIATSKTGRGGKQKLPRVFTEHGVAMLSSVLRSPRAVQVNIAIMRAFVRMRRLLATPSELIAQLNQLADSVQLHEEQIKTIADVLRRMMEPPQQPPDSPKRKIGFRPELHASHSPNGQAAPGARR